jgi:LuxR family transcriptional regulator
MKTWQEDQLCTLDRIECEHELFRALAAAARRLGFDYCAYGLRMPLPLSNPRTVMFNNYPEAWQKRYEAERYLLIDPTVRHGMQSTLPVVWSDDLFNPTLEFWEDARSFGLRHGWAQSSRGADGVGGMLTLARSGEQLSETKMREKGLRMSWLAQVAHCSMSRILTAKLMPEASVQLSSREVAVLRWTAEGKTSSEISDILRISERTVNFHISNAMVKLNSANKTAAAVRAALLGLLN